MTKMSLDADCRLSEGLQVVLQTRGMYRCYQLASTLHRSAGWIIWMMKNVVQRHWVSVFCVGVWPGDKNCHATGWRI